MVCKDSGGVKSLEYNEPAGIASLSAIFMPLNAVFSTLPLDSLVDCIVDWLQEAFPQDAHNPKSAKNKITYRLDQFYQWLKLSNIFSHQ